MGTRRFIAWRSDSRRSRCQTICTISPGISYGLGWFLGSWQGHKTIFHAGNIDGFNAMVAFLPDENLGLVMLSNVSDSPLSKEVMNIVWNGIAGSGTAVKTEQTIAVSP